MFIHIQTDTNIGMKISNAQSITLTDWRQLSVGREWLINLGKRHGVRIEGALQPF